MMLAGEEVKQVLAFLNNTPKLLVKLLYGCGLRITEAVRLQMQDIDYGYKQVTVRNGKGMKDRGLPLSGNSRTVVAQQSERS